MLPQLFDGDRARQADQMPAKNDDLIKIVLTVTLCNRKFQEGWPVIMLKFFLIEDFQLIPVVTFGNQFSTVLRQLTAQIIHFHFTVRVLMDINSASSLVHIGFSLPESK